MATVVNNPGTGDSGGGMGMFMGMLLLVIVVVLFLVYGLPGLRQAGNTTQPQINIPDQIDVNVQPPAQNPPAQ